MFVKVYFVAYDKPVVINTDHIAWMDRESDGRLAIILGGVRKKIEKQSEKIIFDALGVSL